MEEIPYREDNILYREYNNIPTINKNISNIEDFLISNFHGSLKILIQTPKEMNSINIVPSYLEPKSKNKIYSLYDLEHTIERNRGVIPLPHHYPTIPDLILEKNKIYEFKKQAEMMAGTEAEELAEALAEFRSSAPYHSFGVSFLIDYLKK